MKKYIAGKLLRCLKEHINSFWNTIYSLSCWELMKISVPLSCLSVQFNVKLLGRFTHKVSCILWSKISEIEQCFQNVLFFSHKSYYKKKNEEWPDFNTRHRINDRRILNSIFICVDYSVFCIWPIPAVSQDQGAPPNTVEVVICAVPWMTIWRLVPEVSQSHIPSIHMYIYKFLCGCQRLT